MKRFSPIVRHFFNKPTSTLQYVVHCEKQKKCAIIDPVLDYDVVSGRVSTSSVEEIVSYVEKEGLHVQYILETHIHADHLSGAQALKSHFHKALYGMGRRVLEVQKIFSPKFGLKFDDIVAKNHQKKTFDHLFDDGEKFALGEIPSKIHFTPGHTPACATYEIGDSLFVGDTIFMPDSGSARCDFPGGSSSELFHSVKDILYRFDPHCKIYVCHDYQPNNRELLYQTTVGEQREKNIHIQNTTEEEKFTDLRDTRDATLSLPKLIIPSLQVNMQGGLLPEPNENGVSFIRIPVNQF